MTNIDIDRVQELVESRFGSVGSGPPQTPTYSFRIAFPAEELTEKQKRSVYQRVIGFADQLKRQTGRPLLRWRVKPEISTEMQFDPPIKVRTLFFRVSADDE
jgi:hypothetical protein